MRRCARLRSSRDRNYPFELMSDAIRSDFTMASPSARNPAGSRGAADNPAPIAASVCGVHTSRVSIRYMPYAACISDEQLLLYGIGSQRRICHGGGLDQRLSISWAACDSGSEICYEFLRAGLDDSQQAIKDIAERVLGGEWQVVAGVEEDVDCRGQRPTSAVSQDDDKLQTAAQVFHGIFQAAEHLGAETVPGHAHDEKVIRPFAEDKLDWHSSIRASENGRERMLRRPSRFARQETQSRGSTGTMWRIKPASSGRPRRSAANDRVPSFNRCRAASLFIGRGLPGISRASHRYVISIVFISRCLVSAMLEIWMRLSRPADGTLAARCNERDSARPARSLTKMLHQAGEQAEGSVVFFAAHESALSPMQVVLHRP
jgi:hypothetical protein